MGINFKVKSHFEAETEVNHPRTNPHCAYFKDDTVKH